MYFVYILYSLKNNKSYVGFTEKLPKERLKEHNFRTSSWTKENGPFMLIYYEKYFCKKDAWHKEKLYRKKICKISYSRV